MPLRLNEIYSAPIDGNNEWVELFNNGDTTINLKDYRLIDASGKSIFIPNILLEPYEYIVATSSSILNNSGDSLTLLKSDIPYDTASFASATSNESYIPCDAIWILTENITKGTSNSSCTESAQTPSSTPTPFSQSNPLAQSPTSSLSLIPTLSSEYNALSYSQLPVTPFSQKHRVTDASVLTAQTENTIILSPSPVVIPTTEFNTTVVKQDVLTHPNFFLLFMSLTATLLITFLLGFNIIQLVKKLRAPYNEAYDDTESTESTADIRSP